MKHIQADIVIIGGGPAGLAAAVSAYDSGCRNIFILERDGELGGILNQCIHNGFGLHTFKEELTGPEYAARFIEQVKEREILFYRNTMVISIGEDHSVTAMNREKGIFVVDAKAVILAMGCRERPRGALNIPGFRPSGIYSAGTAQRYVNMDGYMPGKEVVILGSGDIGLIMARRMTLEGARVRLVAELMPYSGGLKRNIVQCLDDFGIPLRLSTTVIDIIGRKRVEAVVIAQVDENKNPIPGTEERIPCDTLLLSCGLIPENELTRQLNVDMNQVTSGPVVDNSYETSMPGVFACGNVLHVHDLVDFVSAEAKLAGEAAAEYVAATGTDTAGTDAAGTDAAENLAGDGASNRKLPIRGENGVRYTIPCLLDLKHMKPITDVKFRVGNVYQNKYISVYCGEKRIQHLPKKILAPGEMETVKLVKTQLDQAGTFNAITIRLEDD